ncbi:MAG: HlyD family type I secretion periplasmic adaptor subunit [Macromonas sp.]
MNAGHDAVRSSVVIWIAAGALAAFVAWAHWAELDQITRATGQVIASSRNQVVQAPDGGVLAELLVKEGAVVKRGQLLARFDRTRTESSYLESEAKAAALHAAVARLTAEIVGGEPKFPTEVSAYPEFRNTQLALMTKRRAALQEEIAGLEESRKLIQSELDLNLPLLKSGDVSRAEVLKLQRQAAEVRGQMINRRNKYLQDTQAELAKAQEDLASVQQILAQRKEQLAWTEIHSPMDGVVRNVRLTTLGGVARQGDELMQIVPLNDDMIIEAKMRPADVAFVRSGLHANVKMDAYDYTVYGALPGEVTYISADTLTEEVRGNEQPYYRVHVKTGADKLVGPDQRRIDIQPGMTATVEIKTGSTTVWRYLTKPLTKTLDGSLGER